MNVRTQLTNQITAVQTQMQISDEMVYSLFMAQIIFELLGNCFGNLRNQDKKGFCPVTLF